MTELTPEILLRAYANGIFPMAEGRDDDEIFWVDPRRRGIFPLNSFRISRSLARRMRNMPFRISIDEDFAGVVGGCADRAETWINAEIRADNAGGLIYYQSRGFEDYGRIEGRRLADGTVVDKVLKRFDL